MATPAYGASVKLALKHEDTRGTQATGNFVLVPVVSFELGESQAFEDNDLLGLGRDPSRPERSFVEGTGQARVPLDAANLGYWLMAVLGDPETSGVSPTFTHVFRSGKSALRSLSIEQQHPDITPTPQFFMNLGVIADAMTLVLEPTGRAVLELTLVSESQAVATSSAAGTPVEETFNRFSQFQNFVNRGGSALGKATRASIPFRNNHTIDRYIGGGGNIGDIGPGQIQANGELVTRLVDSVLIDEGKNATLDTLELGFTIDADTSVSFLFNQLELGRARPGVSGPGGVDMRFPIAPSKVSGGAEMLTVTLKNDVADYLADL